MAARAWDVADTMEFPDALSCREAAGILPGAGGMVCIHTMQEAGARSFFGLAGAAMCSVVKQRGTDEHLAGGVAAGLHRF